MNNDKGWIQSLFPMHSTAIHTTGGICDGLILKFKSFYLKIYDADGDNPRYLIQGYRYGEDDPVFEDYVNRSDMRKYANQFNIEDFLMRMHDDKIQY